MVYLLEDIFIVVNGEYEFVQEIGSKNHIVATTFVKQVGFLWILGETVNNLNKVDLSIKINMDVTLTTSLAI